MKKIILLVFVAAFSLNARTQVQIDPEITTVELNEHISILASDSLEGRKPGTPGGLKSAEYIRNQLLNAGLKPLGENGFQYFDVVTDIKTGVNNSFSFNDINGKINEDFVPFSFSKNDEVEAGVVFAGYGFDIDEDSLKWNDYANIDVAGKWVILFRGIPGNNNLEEKLEKYASTRDKVLVARDNKAAGVLFVSGVEFDKDDKLVSMYFDKTLSDAGLPVIHIKRNLANKLLSCKSKTVLNLEKEINNNLKPVVFEIPVKVKAATEVIQEIVRTQNVVALLEGNDPELKDEYIVIGAHYDHLGMGGPGSGSRMPDTIAIHNGADDNASGVAGVIEIVEKLSLSEHHPKRSVIAMAFGAEEMGLLGSKYFTDNPLVELKKIKAMINFDMIGRLDMEKKAISVGGTGTSKESENILNSVSEAHDLKLSFSPGGYGPSDHASFYSENIPVFFINTGAQEDYHTPFDDVEFINFEGQKLICDFSVDLLLNLTGMENELTFQKSGPKKQSSGKTKLKITLGIMPDFTSQSDEGLGVAGVSKGRPAEAAGMKKGDLIVALDGKPVKNIYDYMNRLKKFNPGQIITVDIIRDGEKKVLIVNL